MAVEFALLSPVLMIMMVGILVWGQYFWVAHTVQQVANNAARAALAGLDPAERVSLAREAMDSEVADYATLRPQAADIGVDSLSDRIIVSVRYDTAGDAFRALDGLVPSPPKMITRQAAVRLGGY
ncbi:TadE family protein [Caulobacter sp. RHG1]|uniref:TadE family protein n=1 Tax=Caulobacter sp. (strain RHG1) TaxID=2545762 RepID=UPI0019D65F6E|nr:hypothetical protein [Caulobacter sp. RHG1]